MQITIDTKRDTKAEIRKAIDLLLNFVDESKVITNDPQDVFEASPEGMANFFDDNNGTKEEESADSNDLGLEFF